MMRNFMIAAPHTILFGRSNGGRQGRIWNVGGGGEEINTLKVLGLPICPMFKGQAVQEA